MSRLEPGQLGVFRGRTGRTVVSKWRGIWTGRKAPTKSSKPGSPEQQDQRLKFGEVNKFLRLFAKEIAIGWQSDKRNETAMNEAVRYHLDKAVKGEYPDYQIDYEKVFISRGRGKIDGGFQPVAKAGAGFSIDISWIVSTKTSRITKPTDKLKVVLLDVRYRPGELKAIHCNVTAQRSDLKANVAVPEICKKHPLHVYMFFSSKDQKLASKSEYLGILTPGE